MKLRLQTHRVHLVL